MMRFGGNWHKYIGSNIHSVNGKLTEIIVFLPATQHFLSCQGGIIYLNLWHPDIKDTYFAQKSRTNIPMNPKPKQRYLHTLHKGGMGKHCSNYDDLHNCIVHNIIIIKGKRTETD